MDEMKLKLSTKFMRSIVSKIVEKTIQKKLGYKINIQLNEIEVSSIDGETKFHLDVDASCSSDEFKKIMKEISGD